MADIVSEARFAEVLAYIQTHNLPKLEQALSEGFPTGYRSKELADWTLLERACASRSVGALKMLFRHNVDVNAVDKKGDSALHLACRFGFYDGVRLLLDAGADWTIKNNKGKTPLESATDVIFAGKVDTYIKYCVGKKDVIKNDKKSPVYEYEL